ncbi:hypothetical protein FIE12Z_3853 [Fusarium flagelliforme]|uniref:Uncharacterized protein n=1 Tax=Fusarium flagelliforme TaxID=2675880 RepID=A0A395MVH3_9HYPO|nr:hypothetical protein FIE12Z_3853 [Fusarium flagelliforme]
MPIEDYYRDDGIRLETTEIEAALEPLNWASDISQAALDLVLNPASDLLTHRVTRAVLVRHHRGREDIVGYLHLAAFGCKLLRLIWQDADADRALFLITELMALEELARKMAAKEDLDENEDKFLEMINL